MLTAAGQDFDALRTAAASRDFHPVALPLRVQTRLVSRIRPIMTWNVIGLLPGRDVRVGLTL